MQHWNENLNDDKVKMTQNPIMILILNLRFLGSYLQKFKIE